jgi:hypothetical protein
VKGENHKKLRRRKERIERRLRRRNWPEQRRPMFKARNLRYEVSDRIRATVPGGIGAIHVMAGRLGLDKAINGSLSVFKRHLPYFESDHVLNMAYNVLAGGTKLEDIELLRNDEAYLDIIGAQRIPDPTTAGDFLRRVDETGVEGLMDSVNGIRQEVWRQEPKKFRRTAIIDVDGSIVPTLGEKKEGMGLSYKGIWGYHPLLITLANTAEPLYIVNRPGNAASHTGCVRWVEKAIDLCEGSYEEVLLRGDTDFSLTGEFDGWSERGVRFVFGYDAHQNLVTRALELPRSAFSVLRRDRARRGPRREKRESVKERIVEERGYENIKLCSESIAEFEYRPGKCRRSYRMIVLRKDLSMERGERALIPNVRFFFYITNDPDMSAETVVLHANARCNQENIIEQLKNGVNALRVPVYDLISNWAYMVIASLAWTLKAWFGLTLRDERDRREIVEMEFKRFHNTVIRVPCQIITGARSVKVRILGYTERVRLLLASMRATAPLGVC